MAGDAEQTDSSGKYTFGGGAAAAKKYVVCILSEVISHIHRSGTRGFF